MRSWLKQLICLHRDSVIPTGRTGLIIAQGRCVRCGKLFLVHLQEQTMLPWPKNGDEAFDDMGIPRALPPAKVKP